MKIQLRKLTVIISMILSSTTAMSADDSAEFNQFKNQQINDANAIKDEFAQYKKELEDGFNAYKKAYNEAYKAHKNEITNVWGDYRPGDKKRWVEYDKAGIRKSVNFESGEIELEMLVDKKESDKKIEDSLKQKILALLKTTEKEAFNNDSVAQAVEKQMANKPLVKTSSVPDKPVMSSLIPETRSSDPKALNKLSKKLADKSKTDVRPAKVEDKKIVRVKFSVPVNAPEKSKQFVSTAKQISDKEQVPLTLVLAVMETESAFNPMAKSHVPAYGLMQIVPRSAGQDATAYLFGKAKILSPSYLYNSDNNIEIGGAYLHILYYNYLKNIEDPVSRLYCAIAAYNTGAGNVAKAFTGNTNISKAAEIINKLSPKEVYQKLRRNLPFDETRNYVKKVSTNMQKYQQI